MNLEQLGFTQEELQDRVVKTIVDDLTKTRTSDEEGFEYSAVSRFKGELQGRIKAAVDAKINSVFDGEIVPRIEEMIDECTLQETNTWGEKRGEPMTFVEYLVNRSDAYLREKVDFSGKTKAQDSGYNWKGCQTRVAFLVHKHLHYSMETFAKQALKDANSTITESLEEAVKIALHGVQERLKVKVTVPR